MVVQDTLLLINFTSMKCDSYLSLSLLSLSLCLCLPLLLFLSLPPPLILTKDHAGFEPLPNPSYVQITGKHYRAHHFP